MNRIIFYDINRDMCDAWNKKFEGCIDVSVENIPFKDVNAKYVVTAGNSYGVMTGGIDLAVRNYFGMVVQDVIQEQIFFRSDKKMLPVGECLIIPTPDNTKQNLVYAPTMETPSRIDKINVYKAMKSVLESCYEKAGSIAVCGLGTGTGGVSYIDSADMCYEAYNDHMKKVRGF